MSQMLKSLRFFRLNMLIGGLMVLALLLAACPAPAPGAPAGGDDSEMMVEESGEKTLTVASTFAETTFDPHFMLRIDGAGLTLLTFETLVEFNEDMEIVPLLAESWEVSEDGRTWTFNLRQGVTFHDGTPFNAEAVKATWERFLDPEVGAKDTRRLEPILESLEVVDEHTLNLTTFDPYPELLTNLTDVHTAIISPTAAEKYDPADFGHEEPVGTGPFKFEQWVSADRFELVRNEEYWGDKDVWADRIVFRTIPESASLVAALEAGEIDVALGVPAEEAARLGENADLSVGTYEAFRTFMASMLVTVAPFDDVRVRHALNYAVDKEALTQFVMAGFAKPTETVLFPGLPYRVAQEPYAYDPDKARELLAEAGYSDGFETTLAYTPQWDKGKEMAETIAAYLQDVGVTAELLSMEAAVLSEFYRDTAEVPDRRIFMVRKSAFGVDFNLTRLFTQASFDDDNRERYFNQEVEDLLAEARFSFDEELRANNYAEVQRIVWEDAPEIFLFTATPAFATQADVTGLWFRTDGVPTLAEVSKE
ncbi:MAG: ABC transporter substrate-binding protein [Chloroflexota bacterium]